MNQYKLWLFDDRDWDYSGFYRKSVEEQVKKIFKFVSKVADFSCCIVFDVEKDPPYLHLKEIEDLVICDAAGYTDDNSIYYPKNLNLHE